MLSCDRSNLRVLVADDHELTRLSLKLALASQSNIQLVGTAKNGQEAVEMVKNYDPDVIILDLQMPVMDGWLASSQIKQINPQTQIIAYSAMEEAQAAAINPAACVDAFCRKDTNTQDLISLVKELGHKSSSESRSVC